MTKRRKTVIVICGAVILISTFLLFSGMYMLSYSLCPDGKEERDAESSDFLRRHYPEAAVWTDSMRNCGCLRDTFIINADGLRLHALYASCEDARGTAVLSHGYTDCALRIMMLGQMYSDSLHFNILAPDHVWHGQSDGEAIQMGWKDRLNLEQWIKIADSLWQGKPIYLHGISMGGATVMMCAGDTLPPSVHGIIEDCGYTSVWDEFSMQMKEEFGLPPHPLLDIASLLCRCRYGWDFKEASALKQVERSTLPMLFIHGDNDTYVPTWMVYALYRAKQNGKKRLWIAHGSEHARAFCDHRNEYIVQVKEFISDCK